MQLDVVQWVFIANIYISAGHVWECSSHRGNDINYGTETPGVWPILSTSWIGKWWGTPCSLTVFYTTFEAFSKPRTKQDFSRPELIAKIGKRSFGNLRTSSLMSFKKTSSYKLTKFSTSGKSISMSEWRKLFWSVLARNICRLHPFNAED